MKALTDMNGDLMFDRLGKFEGEWNKLKRVAAALESVEKALELDKQAFCNFSEKSLLKLMLERIRAGTVDVNACGHCESVFAFELGSRAKLQCTSQMPVLLLSL